MDEINLVLRSRNASFLPGFAERLDIITHNMKTIQPVTALEKCQFYTTDLKAVFSQLFLVFASFIYSNVLSKQLVVNPLKRQGGEWNEGQCQNEAENCSLIHRPFYFHKQKTQFITYPLSSFYFSSEAIVRLYYTATTCFTVMQEIHLIFVNFTFHLAAPSFFWLSPNQCRALPCSSPKVYNSQVNLGHGWGTQIMCTYLTWPWPCLIKPLVLRTPFSWLAQDSSVVPKAF